MLKLKIDLVPGAIPYKSQVRPLNPDQKNNLRDQINEWLEPGVIEPWVSPRALPIVPLEKNDGRTRWVTDLRELNKQTVKDSPQSARRYSVFLSRCLWSISCNKNRTWKPSVHNIY